MANDNVYLNGQILPSHSAAVSVHDAGLLLGASTFTTMLARNGRVFRIDQHTDRLFETVDLLGLATDATPELIVEETHSLLRINELTDARCRVTLTPGAPEWNQPTTLITAEPLVMFPPEWYTEGIMAVVSSFKQIPGHPTFGHKTGNYLTRQLALREALEKGGQDALWYTPDGRLAEGCTSNVFLVLDGKVHTPPRDTPVLPGVVRQAVLELCDNLDIPTDAETPLTVHEMLAADEIFLTSSIKGIRPVTKVEAHCVGDSAPGPITRRIMQAYTELLSRECPPLDGEGGE
ncbi:MAG: aminotransferase class IV [Phycisphaerae bacterium]